MSGNCSCLWGACFTFALLVQSSFAYPHWPDQAPHQVANLDDFKLESGEVINNFKITYVTHGTLNAAKDNAVLFLHGFATNHHLADHLIGPGRPLDTDKYFIICADELGSTQTSFQHTTSPTSSGLKMNFPQYNDRDRVNAEFRLVKEVLGISRVLAVGGISSGAVHSVQFAISHPQFMRGIFPIVGGARWPHQGMFFGSLMISILETCPGWDGGNYDKNPQQCATNALSVLIPYFYTRDWWHQYVDTPEAYTKWRNQWGAYYLDIQDARDLYYRARAGGSLGDSPGFNGDLEAALRAIKARSLFLISPEDLFFSPEEIHADARAIADASVVEIPSSAGHLICCNADPQATRVLGDEIARFLADLWLTRNGPE